MIIANDETLKTGDYDAAQVDESLFFTIVCHRVGLDSQEAIDSATSWPGTTNGWQYVPREELPEEWFTVGDGAISVSPTNDPFDAPYPQPCGDHPDTHVHVLAAC